MYFTIPADILGVDDPASDTPVYLDNGVQIPSAPPNIHQKFGEGYSITLPTGPRKRTFTGSFSNRTEDEIDLIDRYFTYLQGEPINDFNIFTTAANVVCLKWNVINRDGDVASLQAEFTEVFR